MSTRSLYTVAVVCAASIGVAAWTWMTNSYAWQVTPESLVAAIREYDDSLPHDAPGHIDRNRGPSLFVALRGIPIPELENSYPWIEYAREYPGRKLLVHEPGNMRAHVWVHCGWIDPTSVRASDSLVGRIYLDEYPFTVDMTESRFTRASIAGLVVGATGVIVFCGTCWLWLRRRSTAGEHPGGRTT